MRFSCDIFTILDCKERRARGALIGFRPGRSFYFSCTHVKACGNSRDTKVGTFCGVKKKNKTKNINRRINDDIVSTYFTHKSN